MDEVSLTLALTLAVSCIKDKIKTLAVDAYMHDMCLATYPGAIKASKQRQILKDAIAVLETEIKNVKHQ